MTTKKEPFLWILAAAAAAAALAGSLAAFELWGGSLRPLGLPEPPAGELTGFTSLFWGEVVFRLLMALVALSVLLFPVYLVASLRSKRGRQRLLIDAVIAALLVGVMLLFYRSVSNLEELEPVEDPPLELVNPGDDLPALPPAPDAPPEAPDLPPWLGWAAAAALAGLVTLAAAYLVSRRKPPPLEFMTLDRLADEAQEALDALRQGGEVEDVIVRCYEAMSRVLAEERRIQRQEAMTPREFERLLAEKGLPREPVRRLTHLFEEVRYGRRKPQRREEDLARLSLSEIVQHCRGGPA